MASYSKAPLPRLAVPLSRGEEEYLDNWILGIINSVALAPCFYIRPKEDGTNLLVFQIEHTAKKVLEIFKSRFKFGPAIFERASLL